MGRLGNLLFDTRFLVVMMGLLLGLGLFSAYIGYSDYVDRVERVEKQQETANSEELKRLAEISYQNCIAVKEVQRVAVENRKVVVLIDQIRQRNPQPFVGLDVPSVESAMTLEKRFENIGSGVQDCEEIRTKGP